jgi:hypothetical protein
MILFNYCKCQGFGLKLKPEPSLYVLSSLQKYEDDLRRIGRIDKWLGPFFRGRK